MHGEGASYDRRVNHDIDFVPRFLDYTSRTQVGNSHHLRADPELVGQSDRIAFLGCFRA